MFALFAWPFFSFFLFSFPLFFRQILTHIHFLSLLETETGSLEDERERES